MDPLLISAASGMNARMEALDLVANNIANAGTASYKADNEFNNLFQSQFPFVQKQWTDYSQGNLTPAGNPLTLALSGPGFFALNTPAGIIYTRNGNFQISKSNQLQTPEGYTARNVDDQGKPILVDPAQAIDIDKDGVVRQGGREAGRIEVDTVEDPRANLKKQGTSYYALSADAPAPKPAAATQVLQGTVEQSNVSVSEQAVRLLNVMRQFEMLQRAMTVGTNMDKQAIQEVAKVSS